MISFILNNKDISTALPPATLLLDFIRYNRHLTGTKIGCREGDCGACTIMVGELIDGEMEYHTATSCLMPIGNANGKHIVTVEGINMDGLGFVQQSFAEEGATQCGFCTPGFIMSLTGFCLNRMAMHEVPPKEFVSGNICRCTGYKSIERAAEKVGRKLQTRTGTDIISFAIENKMVPGYFSTIADRLLEKAHEVAERRQKKVERKKFVGGGTDLYVQQHDSIVNEDVELMLDKHHLNGIQVENGICTLGASVTVADLGASKIIQRHIPEIRNYIKLVSSTQIRNMATIAGNFVNASPIGDFSIFFLVLNAILRLEGGEIKRDVPLRDFYKGYKLLNKTPEEHIEKISFMLPVEGTYFNFEKVSKRTHLDIASVNSAIQLKVTGNIIADAGLSAGGVSPVPKFLKESSLFLLGKEVVPEVIKELMPIIQSEISPITDTRGTELYKRLLLSQLVKAHFIKLFPDLDPALILNIRHA